MSKNNGNKKFIFNVQPQEIAAAKKIAETFMMWYNTPRWDKAKIKMDSRFTVHETETGTIVVNQIQ